MGKTFSKQHAG